MRYKKDILCIIGAIFILSTLIGCEATNILEKTNISPSGEMQEQLSNHALLQEIYALNLPDYRIYSSELLDTYFIACALYFNFDSEELLPNTQNDVLFSKVKEYFKVYKSHPFIQNLESFVDIEHHAHRDGVVYPLIMYAFSNVDYGMGVDSIRTDVFQDGKQFNIFLQALTQFYLDTEAQTFFQSLQIHKDMEIKIQNEIDTLPVDTLISEMESYVGNKELLFSDQSVKYRSIMTVFRPFNASFYTIQYGGDIYLVGQQSPIGQSKKSDSFDMAQTINTMIHEFLHSYINPPVYEHNDKILSLAENKEKTNYAGAMYQDMEWHRIVDENIVRVVETRIFGSVLNDQEKAFDYILDKEIKFSEMPKLQQLYDALPKYEQHRDTYQTIDTFIPDLISVMFE